MKDSSPGDSPDLDAAAARWIARRDRGMTPGEREAFGRWLAEERHAETFARCEAVWDALPRLGRLPERQLEAPANRPRRLAPAVGIGLAAAALAALVVRTAVRAPPRPEAVAGSYAAPADAEGRVALPDESVAILRRGSRIAWSDFAEARRVRLLEGEALVTVAKSSAKPFLLQAGPMTVHDLGTAFDVRMDSDAVSVLVTQGLVELRGAAGSAAAPVRLARGQEAVIFSHRPAAGIEFRRVDGGEIGRELSWRHRRLDFDRTKLSDVVSELNRYNVRQIVLADRSQGNALISGSVRSDELDVFLHLLETGFGFKADRRGGTILLERTN